MTAMELAIENKLGKNIGRYLDFMNEIPDIDRKYEVRFLSYEIRLYWSHSNLWEETKEKGHPGLVKKLKRERKTSHRKDIKEAVRFSVKAERSGVVSPDAILEIRKYIIKLLGYEENDPYYKELNDMVLSQPNKKEIEQMVTEIHRRYKIPKLSDNLRGLLPQI